MLTLRSRQDFVTEDMWKLVNPNLLISAHSTLSRLSDREQFKRFTLAQQAKGGWYSEEEVFPEILRRYTGCS